MLKLINYNPFIHSIYSRLVKTDSSWAKYTVNGEAHIGIIKIFIKITECNCRQLCECPSEYSAIIQKCNTIQNCLAELNEEELVLIPHMYEVIEELDEYCVVNIAELECVCYSTKINDNLNTHSYVSEPINSMELE